MGFLFTVVYITLTILSPADLFPTLGEYRIMLWLAGVAVLASASGVFSARCLKLPQFYLVLGFIVAVCLSHALNGWFGGVPPTLERFLPVVIVFFLIIWNVTTLPRLWFLAGLLIVIAMYLISVGASAYYSGAEEDPYLYIQRVPDSNGEVRRYPRIRALGSLNDPNDFAQFLTILLPFLVAAWRPGRRARNFLICLLPAAAVAYGIYLTNSRGALLALALMTVFLLAERLGKKKAMLLAPFAFALILALNQSGRAISIQEDSARGRVDAWSEGLGMFKDRPLWGVGAGLFTDRYELTAHNSFVLCLAELGLLGSFFWLAVIVATVTGLGAVIRNWQGDPADHDVRLVKAVRLSLYTLLATSWFLSRTYSMTLYLGLGIASAVPGMFGDAGEPAPPRRSWAAVTMMVLPAAIFVVYVTVRLRGL